MVKAVALTVGLCAILSLAAPVSADVFYQTTEPIGGGTALPSNAKDDLGDGQYQNKGFNFYDDVIRANSLLGGYDDVANEGPILTAARVVNFMLTLLGTVSLALMVYAGFLWMTAQGSEDQIGKAKGILQGTVIGIFIVLASYGITSYIFRTFVTLTN